MRTKPFITAAAFAFCAQGLFAAQTSNWIEQHLRAKQGVYSVEESNAAYRAEPQPAPSSWIEQHNKAKQGAYSQMEEARLENERSSAAFRAEPNTAPATHWIDQNRRVKQGQ